MNPKYLLYLGYLAVVLGTGMLLAIYVMMFFPFKTIELTSPIKILTPQVKRGESVVYQFNYCKYTSAQAELTFSFEDGFTYIQPSVTSNTAAGCGTVQRAVFIPYNLPAEAYHLHITAVYHLNPFNTVTRNYDTPDFKVLNQSVFATPPRIDKTGRVVIITPTPIPTQPVEQDQTIIIQPESDKESSGAVQTTPTPAPPEKPSPPVQSIIKGVKNILNL